MRFFILLLFFCLNIFSQKTIKGIVYSDKNVLLYGASVYLNNTTIGTITDEKGKFEIKIPEGDFNLIVSFMGHQLVNTPVNKNTSENLTIVMKEVAYSIDEVVIKKTKYDNEWKYNLARFKQAFFGVSKLAKTCVILNEKDISFDYDKKLNKLTTYARKPLVIKHKGLGYKINFDLVSFQLQGKLSFFSGYSNYQNLKKRVRRRWKKSRLKAYNGSQMHFFRSLLKSKVKENGFIVNQFERKLNPERPSEERISRAKELVRFSGKFYKVERPISPLDSAMVVLQKARKMPKYQDFLYKKNTPLTDIITFNKGRASLIFKNHLMVIYNREEEEENYQKQLFKKEIPLKVQTSNIVLTKEKAILDKTGVTLEANAFINEGYWAFESFATMLPLDYKPQKTL